MSIVAVMTWMKIVEMGRCRIFLIWGFLMEEYKLY